MRNPELNYIFNDAVELIIDQVMDYLKDEEYIQTEEEHHVANLFRFVLGEIAEQFDMYEVLCKKQDILYGKCLHLQNKQNLIRQYVRKECDTERELQVKIDQARKDLSALDEGKYDLQCLDNLLTLLSE